MPFVIEVGSNGYRKIQRFAPEPLSSLIPILPGCLVSDELWDSIWRLPATVNPARTTRILGQRTGPTLSLITQSDKKD